MVFSLYHEQRLREDVMDLLVVLYLQPDDVRRWRGGPSSEGRRGRPGRRLAGPHSWSAVCLWRVWELHGATATAMQSYITDSVEQHSFSISNAPRSQGLVPLCKGIEVFQAEVFASLAGLAHLVAQREVQGAWPCLMTASSMEGVATSTEAGNGIVCNASRLLPGRLLGLPLVGPSLQCISSVQQHAQQRSHKASNSPRRRVFLRCRAPSTAHSRPSSCPTDDWDHRFAHQPCH